MTSNLTFAEVFMLFGTMAVLALMPSVSVLTVSSRSASFGIAHGLYATLGVVAGDIVYILIAIYGLSMIATMAGGHTALVHYLGGVYLLWLGIRLWSGDTAGLDRNDSGDSSRLSSFLSGLLITLADQKAILFYLGLFPAFLDLSSISMADTGLVVAVAILAVGGPKLVYVYLADRAGRLFQEARLARILNRIAGAVLVAVGIWLFVGS